MSLSAIIRVQKQDGESIVMFPGEKVLLNKNDPSSTLVKVATNVGELEQVFTSDSNQVDTTAWDWFTNEVSEQFQTFALEYTPWTQLEKITQIDESVNTNRLLFFNKRKKALLEVENLFNKIQKLIKTRANCET